MPKCNLINLDGMGSVPHVVDFELFTISSISNCVRSQNASSLVLSLN